MFDLKFNIKDSKKLIIYFVVVNFDFDNIFFCEMKVQFKQIFDIYDEVFNLDFKGYNCVSGLFKVVVNMVLV